jgi:predicted RNA-binding Zn ribbon-like protein
MHTDTATPPALRHVEAFLNTLDERRFVRRGQRHLGGDLLASEEALAGWLVGRGLLRPGEPVDSDSFALALALRQALREALAARAGLGTDAHSTVLASLPLYLAVDPSGTVRVQPLQEGTAHGAIGSLAANVAAAVAAGTWSRLKMCASAECRWVIYDGSRNGLGRWCAMGACGNRAKTRTYRQRQTTRRAPAGLGDGVVGV